MPRSKARSKSRVSVSKPVPISYGLEMDLQRLGVRMSSTETAAAGSSKHKSDAPKPENKEAVLAIIEYPTEGVRAVLPWYQICGFNDFLYHTRNAFSVPSDWEPCIHPFGSHAPCWLGPRITAKQWETKGFFAQMMDTGRLHMHFLPSEPVIKGLLADFKRAVEEERKRQLAAQAVDFLTVAAELPFTALEQDRDENAEDKEYEEIGVNTNDVKYEDEEDGGVPLYSW